MLFYYVVMVTLGFVPLRTSTIWRKFCTPHVLYEKWTTVFTYYVAGSPKLPLVLAQFKKQIHTHTYKAHVYINIYTHTHTHTYSAHTITLMLVAF